MRSLIRASFSGTRRLVMKKIPLTKDQVVLVDDEDFRWLSLWDWNAYFDKKYSTPTYHARRTVHFKLPDGTPSSQTLLMSRFIMNPEYNEVVDHIDGDTLNNQKKNLRVCSHAENCRNRSPQNGRKFKGITWSKASKKWTACLYLMGKRKHLGYFNDPSDAAHAYDIAARKTYGKFARLNFQRD